MKLRLSSPAPLRTGFGNALLLSGDTKFMDAGRTNLDSVNANRKTIDGVEMYPHMHGDEGWYDFSPSPYSQGAQEVYYWSMDKADLGRLDAAGGWFGYLEGNNSSYPEVALQADFERLRGQMEKVRNDPTTPDTRLSDNPNPFNPAIPGGLTQLMMGGLTPRHGGPLHCRVRYFDPRAGRAGMPEGVGALVEKLEDESMVLTLVNTDPVEGKDVVVQGGAYAEHQLASVKVGGKETTVDDSSFAVELAPGAGATLEIEMKRYANGVTFAFPWDR